MDPSAEDYGQFFWRIKTKLSADGEISAHADEAKILPDGTLVLLRTREGGVPEINLSISAGNWQAVYAAHPRDGSPFAIKGWAGEVGGGRTKAPVARPKARTSP
jgi:hypothetical protein